MLSTLIFLVLGAWWFLWKKKYYIQIDDAGSDADGMIQILKTQLELTLTEAQELYKTLPALVKGGNFLNARTVAKAINEAGGQAKVTFHWFWQNPLGKEEPERDENGKKKKTTDSDAKHEMGGYSFTEEDIDAITQPSDAANEKAYAKLVDAMNIGGENFYPETLEETQQMDALLDESEKAAKNLDDPEYRKMLKEMRGIVGWSNRRHFNFSWFVILCSILTLAFMKLLVNADKEHKQMLEDRLVQVKAWNIENDTISLEQAMDLTHVDYIYYSPNCYKASLIRDRKRWIVETEEDIEKYRHSADTTQSSHMKKVYLKNAKHSEESKEKYQKELAEYEQWSLKDAQKGAIKEVKHRLHWANKGLRTTIKWFIFFILLIPLYIIANFAYGYNITRHREESKILSAIHKWIVGIGVGLVATGWLMELLPDYIVTTYWSDGHTTTHTEVDPGNIMVVGFKIGLIILGLIVIAFISSAIMLYSTIVGLIRNYNWKAIFAKLKK